VSEGISILVNGEPRTVAAGGNVTALLQTLGIPEGRVAIERNLEILPRSAWLTTIVAAGDRFEIVHFVGGG